MNRIYQGRVAKVELQGAKSDTAEAVPIDVLWQHHVLFQDAVNYYLIAVAAMASDVESPAGKLRQRMAEAWEPFDRAGRKFDGLHRSLSRINCPGITEKSSVEDGFKAVLAGNLAEPKALQLAVDLLLAKVSGDAAIQQGGRAYWPRLCNPKARPTWDYSTESLKSGSGKNKLAQSIHQELDDAQRTDLANELQLSWTVKLQPDSLFNAEESKKRLEEAVDYFTKALTAPDKRQAQFLEKYPNAFKELLKLREDIKNLDSPLIPRNRKAAPSLTFSTLLFKYFPSAMTQSLLALHVAKSKAAKVAVEADGFASLGDDPIKLARRDRGYVFPAFTSFPVWGASNHGDIRWSEFDVAAFKEALKTVNQFRLKTDDRLKQRRKYEAAVAYMEGAKKWEDPEAAENDEPPGRLKGDPRREIVRQLLKKRWIENDMIEGIEYAESPRAIGRRALRGWEDLTEKWNKAVKPGEIFGEAAYKKLNTILGEFQTAHRDDMGDVNLYETLIKNSDYWCLWQRPTPEQREERRKNDWSDHILKDCRLFLEYGEEIKKLGEAIRFTPADARESRRLFMFSDLTGRSKHKHRTVSQEPENKTRGVDVSIAMNVSGAWQEQRVRLDYTAPRLMRDRLRQVKGEENLTAASWEQPMMEALGWGENCTQDISDCAVSLMPDLDRNGQRRFLLNFPVSLESPISEEQKQRAERWKNQFNGKDGTNIHLHWPTTMDKKYHERGWWKRPTPFSFISADLGTRACASWAQFEVSPGEPATNEHHLGTAEGQTWKARMKFQGQFRLSGEDAKVLEKGRWVSEPYGEKGRKADPSETVQAKEMAKTLEFSDADIAWEQKRFPEQNYLLLVAFRRCQGKLARYNRWLRFLRDTKKKADIFEELSKLLTEAEINPPSQLPSAWSDWIERKSDGPLCVELEREIGRFQDILKNQVRALSNRIVPLRGRQWEWAKREDGKNWILRQTEPGTASAQVKIRGQRGLSLRRIEQLEDLRRRLQSLNRALQRKPGEKVLMGRASRAIELPDPCPDILLKLDAMKEQRVNQTAHLILAQALGVRLKAHMVDEEERRTRDLHGEYEQIPDRKPVDFIVLEDLSRYRTSQDRGPSENSRLMKWCHRAVTEKLKELCEPYGIPVLETPPAYTSQFCSKTGIAGFRAREITNRELPLKGKRLDEKEYREYEELFKTLDKEAPGKHLALFIPEQGGPRFVAYYYDQGEPKEISRDADINAAINLGLRAVAAPDNLRILNRLRCASQGVELVYQDATKRGKAKFAKPPKLSLKIDSAATEESPHHEENTRMTNVFIDVGGVAQFDRVEIQGEALPAATGKGLWGTIKKNKLKYCLKLNRNRVQHWRKRGLLPPEDNIPL
jgi:IS605 OrfB family transposase